ncbi:diguanylate cyclase domain-containing protein [Corallincola platygyrae]|uniref:Diguanylate cyclase domain-containing protein n=1 Tax=Corallincola platygyrae TaxID=1193278 RepID=A0ABW4XGP5_9GAMM
MWLWIACLSIACVAAALHFYAKQIEQDNRLSQERKILQLLVSNVKEDLAHSISDTDFLQNQIANIVQLPVEPSVKLRDIQTLLFQFATRNPRYYQAGFIDDLGQEIVRVQNEQNGSKIATGSHIKSKHNRPFINTLRRLQAGQVYISRFDFSLIDGQIVHPFHPVIHFAMPVFDQSKIYHGAIVVTLDGQQLKNRLAQVGKASEAVLSFVNGEGLWLFGEDTEQESTRSDQLGTIWPMPVRNSRGIAKGNKKLYLHDVLNYKNLSPTQKLPPMLLEESFFKVVSTLPLAELTPHANQRKKIGLPIFIGLLLAAVVLAVRWQRVSQKDRNSVTQMARLAQIISESQEIICLTDKQGIIRYVNPAFESLTGYQSEECIGQPVSLLKSGYHNDSFYKRLWTRLNAGENFQSIFVNRRKDGSVYYEEKVITPFKSHNDDHETYYFSSGRDITEAKQLQSRTKQLSYLAQHDSLTGLANRPLMEDAINNACERQIDASLVHIDLDDFKKFNNLHGHANGDKLLIQVAARIREVQQEGDTLARLGSDEFTLLVSRALNEAELSRLAERVKTAFSEPYQDASYAYTLTASIGVATLRECGFVSDTCLGKALERATEAKAQGGNRVKMGKQA